MKQVLILGAFDRFNYGDILFPLVIVDQLKRLDKANDLEFRYFGIRSSDLTSRGGVVNMGVKDFVIQCNSNVDNIVIIAGGEVLNAEWALILSYLDKKFAKVYKWYKILFRGRLIDVLDFLARKISGSPSSKPFVILKEDYKNIKKLIYNSVGGPRNSTMKRKDLRIYQKLINSDYFTVRDRWVLKTMKPILPHVRLAPDSAILISEIYDMEILYKKTNYNYIPEKPYLFFQVNKLVGMRNIEMISGQLNKIQEKTGLEIVLCPIGTALGHEDQIPLKNIQPRIKKSIYIRNPTVWDILFLIARSALYIGTSLHGTITAMSFNVPVVGIGSPFSKLDAYLRTWGVTGMDRCVQVNEIEKQAGISLKGKRETMKISLEKQLSQAKEAFREIFEVING